MGLFKDFIHLLSCILPHGSPTISQSILQQAASPVLWARHKPDQFDIWSAGIVLLQLAVPTMRYDRGLKQFNAQFGER